MGMEIFVGGIVLLILGVIIRPFLLDNSNGTASPEDMDSNYVGPYPHVNNSDSETRNKFEILIKMAINGLKIQIELGGRTVPFNDEFSSGYIYGFVDGLFQSTTLSGDDVLWREATEMVYETLYDSREQGMKVLQSMSEKQNQESKETVEAIIKGGSEVRRWLAEQGQEGGYFPTELATHMQKIVGV